MSKAEKLIIQLEEIAKQKEVTILNLDDITDKTVVLFKLEIECDHCEAIKNPTIHDFRKNPNQRCRCLTMKDKKEKLPILETGDWRYIHCLDHPMASKYGLGVVETYYQVSPSGEVRNAMSGSILKSHLSGGYLRLNLKRTETGYKSIFAHVLVACAFTIAPNLPQEEMDTLTVDHIDGNKGNNNATNLRWATPAQQAENRNNKGKLGIPGKVWTDPYGVYFSQEDYDKSCLDKTLSTCFEYKNAYERIAIDDSIEFPNEMWKRVTYKETKYFVSSRGRMYGKGSDKTTFGIRADCGYMRFDSHRVHRIVAIAFLQEELTEKVSSSGVLAEDLIVNHKDGRKYNNTLANLEWLTVSENTNHAVSIGVKPTTPVLQLLDGKVVGRFKSITQASSSIGGDVGRCVQRNRSGDQTHTSAGFVWIEDIKPSNEELIDLSKYLKGGQIKIGQKDFSELAKQSNIVPSIMHLLRSFTSPILPIVTNLPKHYAQLKEDDTQIEEDDDGLFVSTNNRGRPLLNHIMYPAMIKGRPRKQPSYEEVWNTLPLRQKIVERMLKMDERMNNGSLYGCYGCQYGRLYNFPSNVAQALYNSWNSKRILDPCAGYAGRLLGFWASNAEEYVGIDPNVDVPYQKAIECLTEIKERDARVICACAEDVDYSQLGKFDTIFTSPPYFDTEIYSEDETQSCKRYPCFSTWMDKFLLTVLTKVEKVLIPGGVLAINIKDPKGRIIVEPMLEHLRGLGLEEKTHIRLRQAKRHRTNLVYEYIYVFHKRKNTIPKRFRPVGT